MARPAPFARRTAHPYSRIAASGVNDRPAPRSAAETGIASFCLLGFWGVPNFGDEWLLRAAQGFLREAFPGCGLSALVKSARLERRLGRHVDDVALYDGFFPSIGFFAALPRIVRAIRSADLTLIGGGGLINDSYTVFSIPRYAIPALLSIAFGTPVVWWGLGVVPPRRRVLRQLALWTLRHAALVLTRDAPSLAYLQDHGVAALPSQDLSVLGPASPGIAVQRPSATAGRLLVVNFRDAIPALAAARLTFLETRLRQFDRIVLVTAEPCDEPVYTGLLVELAKRQPSATVELVRATDYERIQATIAAASLVVSERLHVSLFALAVGVPTAVLSYESKIDEVVGRLYPTVGITAREQFWRDPDRVLAAVSTAREMRVDLPACKGRIAAQLRAAAGRRVAALPRVKALVWLALLLPPGTVLAAAMWFRRSVAGRHTSGVRKAHRRLRPIARRGEVASGSAG
jgi:polysaccharide pyruvyl transferase WcaK-like protein